MQKINKDLINIRRDKVAKFNLNKKFIIGTAILVKPMEQNQSMYLTVKF